MRAITPVVVMVPTAEAMTALGRRLAAGLRGGDVVSLSGPLGAGKTVLTQGVGAGLKVAGPVLSPTFVLSRVHPPLACGPGLVHVDAYRLGSPQEVDDLGLELSGAEAVTVVEWGELVAAALPQDRLDITIERADDPADQVRRVTIRPRGIRWGPAETDWLVAAVGGGTAPAQDRAAPGGTVTVGDGLALADSGTAVGPSATDHAAGSPPEREVGGRAGTGRVEAKPSSTAGRSAVENRWIGAEAAGSDLGGEKTPSTGEPQPDDAGGRGAAGGDPGRARPAERLVLGIDTAAGVSVGLASDGWVVSRAWLDDSRRHVEALAPLMRQALAEAGAGVGDLTGVAVGMGPGPFTGLRVGIVAAQTLADALGLPLRRVCSLDVVARSYLTALGDGVAPAGEGQFVVWLDARRQEVYWARYDASGRRLEGPAVSRPEDLPALPLIGPGAIPADPAQSGLGEGDGPAVDAGRLAALADDLPPAGLGALYLRRPDATPPGRPKTVLADRSRESGGGR
ncbi:MAG: tRNA (adenosine(37)-N6)-threonylcarbamoyltransferase complex dimerization subunit type 1 TsaB [Propionibacteriaceae bacterium]|jgi:tRNA threonylcarbamoyl adenosine modification protein YeaZ/tRNA threonylcarbamoyl adenosine modification protein YjeE|nr:tRNA (adenosine(37)-N6)-threonylcarbamoyltransferase complex dimerization subunit type 1 TsaB [Propionibacteriaceae bacterium]